MITQTIMEVKGGKEWGDKSTVFISYSHKDEQWKDRIVTHFGVLAKEGLLDTWMIAASAQARKAQEIAKEMIRNMGYHRRDGEVKNLRSGCINSLHF